MGINTDTLFIDHKCLECNEYLCKNRRSFGNHLMRSHKGTDIRSYVLHHYLHDIVPTCMCGCGEFATWHKSAYKFNDYISGHNESGYCVKKTSSTTEKMTSSDNIIVSTRIEQTSKVVHMIQDVQKEHAQPTNVGKDVCKICKEFFPSLRSLATHLQCLHKTTSEEYTIIHILNLEKRPSCNVDGCVNDVRYTTFSFKRYCKNHSSFAESSAGKIGGTIKKQWNKGHTSATDERIAHQALMMSGTGNHFFGKRHTTEILSSISDKKRLSSDEYALRCLNSASSQYYEVLTPYDQYLGRARPFPPLFVRCKKCLEIQERYLVDLERGTRCHHCFPTGSLAESEVAEFVRSLGFNIVQNTRKIIPPKEIDIWVPDKKFGIEYHGLFWHSGGKTNDEEHTKTIHEDKRRLAAKAGIRLFQMFSDEWRDRKDIVKSMIRQRLGCITNKIGARECNVERIESNEGKAFLDRCHMDGSCRASAYFGLRSKDGKLVSVMSVRKPIQKKYGDVRELARFATELNTVCPGAASRLLKYIETWAVNEGASGILSYADLRFGDGLVYESAGFKRVGTTGSQYFYTDGADRLDRFKYRAQSGKTEKQVAEEANVRPVWGCANAIYIKELLVTPHLSIS